MYVAADSDIGGGKQNEDAFLVNRQLGLLIVCDGVGGRKKGEVASRSAVEVTAGLLQPGHEHLLKSAAPKHSNLPDEAASLVAAVRLANLAIYTRQANVWRLRGMSTTLVALRQLADGRICLVHAGDSRAYRYRAGALDPLTNDHADERGRLTRYLGHAPRLDLTVRVEPVRPGDVFILCSDGLYELLDAERIAALCVGLPADPGLLAKALVRSAKQRGSSSADNITAAVALVSAPSTPTAELPTQCEIPDTDSGLCGRYWALLRIGRLVMPWWLPYALTAILAVVAAIIIVIHDNRPIPVRYGSIRISLTTRDTRYEPESVKVAVDGGTRHFTVDGNGRLTIDSVVMDTTHNIFVAALGYMPENILNARLIDSLTDFPIYLRCGLSISIQTDNPQDLVITGIQILTGGHVVYDSTFSVPSNHDASVPAGEMTIRVLYRDGNKERVYSKGPQEFKAGDKFPLLLRAGSEPFVEYRKRPQPR